MLYMKYIVHKVIELSLLTCVCLECSTYMYIIHYLDFSDTPRSYVLCVCPALNLSMLLVSHIYLSMRTSNRFVSDSFFRFFIFFTGKSRSEKGNKLLLPRFFCLIRLGFLFCFFYFYGKIIENPRLRKEINAVYCNNN